MPRGYPPQSPYAICAWVIFCPTTAYVEVMAASTEDRETMGVRHLTVVPGNFEPDEDEEA